MKKKGLLATGPKQRLGDYLIHWLEEVYKPSVRLASYVNCKTVVYAHLVPDLGHLFVQKVTPQHIQAFYTKKLQEGLKPRTVLGFHGVLHKAFENAVKWNVVSRNVVSLVSVPRTDPHQVQVLTALEAQKLVEVARGHWLEPLLIVALTTGLRRGELLGLRWDDIDFDHMQLYVRRTVNRYPGHGYVENDPKTKRSRRNVALSDVAVKALKRQRHAQEQLKAEAGEMWQERNLIFTNPSGCFLGPELVLRHFYALLEKAGLPHMRFHDLRHSAATILLTMGVHPKVVQELLGHSTIAMTMDTYSHLLPSMQRDVAGKMNEVFQLGESSEDY